MKLLFEPVGYSPTDGSVEYISNDIWIKDFDRDYYVVAVVPKTAGWAYIEEPIDVPPSYQTVEYKRNGYYVKGWTGYSRIK